MLLIPSFGLLLGALPAAVGFYLPGVAPTDYAVGDAVPLYVNRLTPGLAERDQSLRSVVPYDYYHPALNFCKPPDGPKEIKESLGSILFGDRILTSPFDIHMAQNETCRALCAPRTYDTRQARFVSRRIWQNYNQNWLIDGLPGATINIDEQGKQFYASGFPIGFVEEAQGSDEPFLAFNNHYDIFIDYHALPTGRSRVVGVVVQPSSRSSKLNGDGTADCEDMTPIELSHDGNTDVLFTYSVTWRPSDTVWATRWDKYLHVVDPKIHWFSLVNSAVIVVFLTGMVAMVVMRALRKDLARYNALDLNEDVQDDSGWKLVHGDVFRTPSNPMMLSLLLGSGAQLFFMTGATIVLALLGFLSPSNRGSLGTVILLLHSLFGFIGGYVSTRAYRQLGGDALKRNIVFTPVFIPGLVFATFFFLNFFLAVQQSSGAVPLGTMCALVGIWFVISVPLSFAGSWFALRARVLEAPTRTNQIPRQIPGPAPLYLRPLPSMLLAGVLPFGAIFVELYFVMNSIWFHRVYYMFGFLFLCYGIMIATTSAVTILMVYFLLCSENYHWQWRAFFTSGACAIYIFLNALVYWVTKLKMGGLTSNVLYLGYSAVIAGLVFVLSGTIGFFATWLFVRKIYSSIKIE